jgi:exodeoxyribonuclease VII small subunit
MDLEKLKFEDAMEKLEMIVQELEDGGLSLDKSLEMFSDGVKLIKFCNNELNKAEKKIEKVLKFDDKFGNIVPFVDENNDT